jgi:hydroxymethylbilane synthase
MTRAARLIRIGTRESSLALYQAREVERRLNANGIATEIIEITSDGDMDLSTPLYEMGIQGIFTKSLDLALLQNRIDLAVHSTKDVPTKLARGLALPAMLERAVAYDCLVLPAGRGIPDFSNACVIGTSSLRRKSQWLHRYPHHATENLRGNIQTRLMKLDASEWSGAIFAHAALIRLEVRSHQLLTLDWMLPSPAQGAIGIVCRSDDAEAIEICKSINHADTHLCVTAERDFLAALHGGCAVPIAANATREGQSIHFRGNVVSLDAKSKIEVEGVYPIDRAAQIGAMAAQEMKQKGADEIIKTFRPA